MKLADVSIRRPVLATVMIGALIVFGLVAYPKVGVDLFPEVEFPVVTVQVVYPGADPETIESRVIDKIEEAVNSVPGIKVLRSTSLENVGLVFIQFELERKADQAVQDVRDKVATVVKLLPKDLEPPVVEKFDLGAAPVLALALSGPRPARELTRLADDVIKERLQTLSGVGGVELVGKREREFQVWLDPARLEAHGLATADVMQALASQNVEIPGGRIDVGSRELIVKTRGQVHSAKELGEIIITGAGALGPPGSSRGAAVRIRDVARVEDGEEEQRSYASLNQQSAVALIVRKQSGANTVAVAQKVKAEVKKLAALLPKDVKLSVPTDNSIYIEHSIKDVQFDLAFGAALAVVIILFFLRDWRATLISALAIPTSVIATIAFIQAMGFTFNNMTMLALSLSIGILVDDAIVVIENIHRHLEMGKPPLRAAAEATNEIGLAVMATTASIVAVFVPVAIMKGMIGRFFLQFGLTVAFAVSVSLFVAFTLTPMMSSRLLAGHSHAKHGGLSALIERFLTALDAGYRRLLQAALRQRAVTLVVAVVTLFASFAVARYVPFEFLPPDDRAQFLVKVELPAGTSFEATRSYVEDIARSLRKMPGVESTFATVGAGTQGEVNVGDVQVNLVPKAKRAFTQEQAMAHARAMLAPRKEAVFAVEPVSPFGSGGAFRQSVIQFNIRGKNYEELNRAASQIIDTMRKSGGYVDIDTTYRGGKPEVAVNIDRDRAADLGVPVSSIALTLRTFIAGDKASELVTDGDRYDVRVRLAAQHRSRPEDILRLKVRAINGQMVDLANVISLGRGTGPAKIERQNRQRQVTIFANLQGKALGNAVNEMETQGKKLPAHLVWDWAGMGDIMKESVANMAVALVLAIIMVYLILAAQFESFVHPFTIMLSLPFSLVGALGALAISRMTLNIFSMIGFIMLMGLVTKNAILLVDYTNQLRSQGVDREEALLRAGPVRLRPILMTTAAMIFGMIPVALALSEGGEQRAPMAVAVIGGLITSTMLTLVVVPVAYSLIDAAGERLFGKRRRGAAELAAVGAQGSVGAGNASRA